MLAATSDLLSAVNSGSLPLTHIYLNLSRVRLCCSPCCLNLLAENKQSQNSCQMVIIAVERICLSKLCQEGVHRYLDCISNFIFHYSVKKAEVEIFKPLIHSSNAYGSQGKQAEGRSPEFSLCLPWEQQGPEYLNPHLLPPRLTLVRMQIRTAESGLAPVLGGRRPSRHCCAKHPLLLLSL